MILPCTLTKADIKQIKGKDQQSFHAIKFIGLLTATKVIYWSFQ